MDQERVQKFRLQRKSRKKRTAFEPCIHRHDSKESTIDLIFITVLCEAMCSSKIFPVSAKLFLPRRPLDPWTALSREFNVRPIFCLLMWWNSVLQSEELGL